MCKWTPSRLRWGRPPWFCHSLDLPCWAASAGLSRSHATALHTCSIKGTEQCCRCSARGPFAIEGIFIPQSSATRERLWSWSVTERFQHTFELLRPLRRRPDVGFLASLHLLNRHLRVRSGMHLPWESSPIHGEAQRPIGCTRRAGAPVNQGTHDEASSLASSNDAMDCSCGPACRESHPRDRHLFSHSGGANKACRRVRPAGPLHLFRRPRWLWLRSFACPPRGSPV